MFHLPGCRAALGSMGWVVAILLTATATSGCTALGLCAFLFLWSNITEARRVSRWKAAEAIRQFVSTGLPIIESSLAARQEQTTPCDRTGRPKIDLLPIPERY